MIRRYDMSRSDNITFSGRIAFPCIDKPAGRFFVYTGFPVSSAIVTPVNLPEGVRLFVDTSFSKENGFEVMYDNVPEDVGGLEIMFQAS